VKKVFFLTGESSGDLHAASLLNELYKIIPEAHLTVEAIGSDHLESAGARIFFNSKYLGSVGLVEVISKLSMYLNLERELLFRFSVFRPDVLVLVDFPGFNLRILKKVKKQFPETKIVYYLPPQVWVWMPHRTKILAEFCDLVLCGLPFEEEFHKERGVNAFYVGNPILSELYKYDRNKIRTELGINTSDTLIGIFPGSRQSEIHYMLPVLLKATESLKKDFPKISFIVSQAKNIELGRHVDRIKILPSEDQNNYKLLCASDIVWLTSGTITLEAALYETSMILRYRGNEINYLFYLLIKKIDLIGLPNIIMSEKIVPELIQKEANSENYYKITKEWLQDTSKLKEIREKLKNVRERLQDKNASYEAALKIRNEFMPEYKVIVMK
jgi:lipid-A-disaccharide synthase